MTVPDLGGKLFSYKIKYKGREGIENPGTAQFAGKNVLPRYNGNIAEVDWRSVETSGVNPSLTPKRYGYAYDGLNRLTAGYYQNPNNPYSKENTESLTYDLNGNVINLYRTSVMEYGSNMATVIDNLAYHYKGNQAARIEDHSGNSTGYEGTAGFPISYDANGNMKNMMDKQITGIAYNHLNLPHTVNIGFDQITSKISTKYRADGVKLRKENVNNSVGFAGTDTTIQITDYLDGFQYFKSTSSHTGSGGGSSELLMMSKRAFEPQAFTPIEISDPVIQPIMGGGWAGTLTPPKTPDLQFFPTSEGFYDYIKNQYIYSYTDHLGNVRVSFARNSAGVLEIVDRNDYYPFGMNHLKTGDSFFGQSSFKKYKYNGKELQETGMYDYGARFYMPDAVIWGTHDPLAEVSRRFSPYAYAFNNPIRFIDPDGRQGEDWIKRGNQIFFDASVTGNAQVQQKYGENAQSITGYNVTKNGITTSYGLGQDGSITTNFANVITTNTNVYQSDNIETGAATILGSKGSDPGYIRATPDNPFANHSSQLAYNGLIGMQMAASGIATEFVAAKTGLTFLSAFGGSSVSLSRNGIGGTYSAITEAEISVGPNLFGKKFGKHGVEDFGFTNDAVGRSLYLNGIENTFFNGAIKQIPVGVKPHGGETHFLQNGNLLRVNNGQFRSYYPLDPTKL